jgi:DNA-binding response OmpR family regulator
MHCQGQKISPISVAPAFQAGCAPVRVVEDEAPPGPKILILDDDQDLLDSYRELLARVPSKPDVHIANSATRAFAMLESEPFALLITDLRMPKIDGFQVLMSVRRKFPSLRTIVLTGLVDEQYRARAYAMGIDLYIEKPATSGEIKLFSQCIESVLVRNAQGGFRGVQSKTLMDLIQFECLAQNTCVLKLTNGSLEAKIWIHNGEVIDAAVKSLVGEEAFKNIFSWKSGNFELLPGEPSRPRRILSSYQGLLLDSAQSLDEANAAGSEPAAVETSRPLSAALAPLVHVNGIESLLLAGSDNGRQFDSWGVEGSEGFAEWCRGAIRNFRALAQELGAGQLDRFEALGPQRHVAVLSGKGKDLIAGLDRSLSPEQVRETVKELAARWDH